MNIKPEVLFASNLFVASPYFNENIIEKRIE